MVHGMTSDVQSGWWHYIDSATPCPCLQDDCRYRKSEGDVYPGNMGSLISSQRLAVRGGAEMLEVGVEWQMGMYRHTFKQKVDVGT